MITGTTTTTPYKITIIKRYEAADGTFAGDFVSSGSGGLDSPQALIFVGASPPPNCGCSDVDGDGFGSPASENCSGGAALDCNDLDASSYPGASELCDGIDNDCSGAPSTDEVDTDADDYFVCEGDCNDANMSVNPAAVELPGNVSDENCDGSLGACDPLASWRNHGQFVRCVAQEVNALRQTGLLDEAAGDDLVESAARSNVGK